METASGDSGNGQTPEPQPARAAPPTDLKQEVRKRKRNDRGLSWGPVTRFVLRLMLRHPFIVGGVLLMTLLLAGMEVANAALIAPFLNMLMGGNVGVLRDSPIGFLIPLFENLPIATQLRWFALIFFGITFVKSAFVYGLTRLAQHLHIVINRDLRLMLFEDILAVEMRWVNKQRSSNLFTLVHSFPGSAAKIVDQYMMGFQNFTSFVAIVVTLALVSVPLLLLSAAIGLVILLIAIQLVRWVRYFAYAVTQSRLRLHYITLEALSALKVLHLFGRVDHTKGKYTRELREYQANQFKQASIRALVSPVQEVLAAIFVASILFGSTVMYDLTTGTYLATIALFMTIATKFQSRSGKYAKRRAAIAAEIPAMEVILDHLEDKEKKYVQDGDRRFDGLRDGVRFEDVRFSYEPSEPEVIKGVSFDVPKGHMVALVGASGAGKSTLIDLLARLYDPDQGRILVDGTDLRRLHLNDWRSRVAVVSQDSFLFNTSVQENIRFGRLDATDDEVKEAARQANADLFIEHLPQGYETILGERGVRLSGGQRQRIAIARAILADPDILILDEATSALDTETEAHVQSAIDKVAKDRTIIAIAHRLSTVRKANTIVVLEDGRIVESGRHSQLLAKRGRYHQYVRLQDLGQQDDQQSASSDERIGWIEVTAKREIGHLIDPVSDLDGVQVARARGRQMDIVVESPSHTLPKIFQLFAEHEVQIHAIDLDDLADSNKAGIYRWSGNGAGGAGDPVRIVFHLDQDAEAALAYLRDAPDVESAEAFGDRLDVILRRPQETVPRLIKQIAASGARLVALTPTDQGDDGQEVDPFEEELDIVFE